MASTPTCPIEIPNFRILELLGHGGMARVYLAEQQNPRRKVVIKIVGPDQIRVSDPALRDKVMARLQREGDIAARFQHPNLVTVFECGVIDDHYYLAMEYIAGGDLRRHEADGLEPPEAIAIALRIAEGLAEMHRLGLSHRDLKPENVLLRENGEPVLVDFGISSDRARGSDVTDLGMRSGTPHFMSPEMFGDKPVDERSDLYSLGVLLYEMLTGKVPFDGNSALAISRAHLEAPIPTLPEHLAEFQPLIDRLLAKEPADRFQTAEEVVAALQRWAPTEPAVAAVRPRTGGPRWLQRKGPQAALVVIPVVGVLLAIWLLAGGDDPPSDRPVATDTAALSPNSLAVLPFANMSPDPENEYFSDGISDEILNTLAQLESLRVAARTSSFQFKGRNEDVGEIGRALRVRHVLEGSVRKHGDRVRITAQLIDVDSGYHLWSETYDRDLDDIFAVQQEIAEAVAVAIEPKLLGKLNRSVNTAQVEAYDLYLLGRHHFHRRNREALEHARVLFEKAIALDPAFALAHVGLANATILLLDSTTTYGDLPLPAVNATAQRNLATAFALTPDLPELHASRGLLDIVNGRYQDAVADLTRALELNPNDAMAYMWRGTTQGFLARFERCLADLETARRIDPLSPAVLANLIWANHLAGPPERTEAYIEEAMLRYPDFLLAWGNAGNVRYMQGRSDEAFELFSHAYEVSPSYRLASDMLGIILLDRGDLTAAEDLLDGAGAAWPQVARGRLTAAGNIVATISEGEFDTRTYVAAAVGDDQAVLTLLEELAPEGGNLPGALMVGSDVSNLGRLPALTIAFVLARSDQPERAAQIRAQARQILENGWNSGARTPGLYYAQAVLDSIEGRPDDALGNLAAAVDLGWQSWWYLRHDPRLAALHDSPAFEELVRRITPATVAATGQVAENQPSH